MEEDAPRRAELWIANGRILAVSPPDPPPAAGCSVSEEFEEVDARGLWILPGFVAAHVHLCQTLFRGRAEGLDLYRWLAQVIWPLEAAHDAESIAISAEAGIAQLLSGGVTTLLDMGTTRHTGAILETAARLGIRGFFGPAWMDRGPRAAAPLFRPEEEFACELDALAARFEGHDDGRIRLALCPRFVPSVSDRLWERLAREPAWRAFPIHTHGSETREEVEEVRSLTGTTPPLFCASLRGAEGRVKMAHAIWVDDADRRGLSGSGAAVLHCPGSNLKLGSGLCDTAALEAAGVPVGLGPDGAACNNRLDPWQEMRLAAYVRTLRHGPSAAEPHAILRSATLGGAEALGLADEIGSLRRGKRADLVVLDPRADLAILDDDTPAEAPAAALVFAGSPALVRETIVAGRTVYRHGDPGQEAALRDLAARARSARARLLAHAQPHNHQEPAP